MSSQPTHPQSIGSVLDTAFQLYRACVVKVAPLSLLMIIAASPPSIYLLMQDRDSNPADPMGAGAAMGDPGYWALYLISVVAATVVFGALFLRVRAIGIDEELSTAASLQLGLARVVPLFLASMLYMIAVVIGSLLLIVPGIILGVSLMLAFNIVAFEGSGPVAALKASHRLVWGNWWRTMAIITVGFIIVLVAYFVIGMLFGILVPSLGIASGNVFLIGTLVGLFVAAMLYLLIMPFYISMLIAIYWDLRLRKEGGDLAARIGSLENA